MILKTLAHRSRIRNTDARNPASWFVDWIRGGVESDSGIAVNGKTVLAYAPFWQGVNVVCGDLGQMPLCVYKRSSEGREEDVRHPAYRLLRRRPNSMMNAGIFKSLLQSHALCWGNGRAGIVRDSRGRPMELVPFLPDRSYEDVIDGKLFHLTKLGDDQKYTAFADEHVLHIKGLGFDGITGYSVISLAKNSVGLGLAAEKHGNRMFRNGAAGRVVLEGEGKFGPEAAKQLLHDWEQMTAGIDNVGKTALLQGGIKAHVLSMSNHDAEWLGTRRAQRGEVANWLNLPPHKVGDDSRISYNSLEQENQAYLDGSLGWWFNVWEEECDEKLLSEQEKRTESHYAEFMTQKRLRADIEKRYAAYAVGISHEFLSPDEVRAKENMNKRPDGKGGVYRNPNTKSAGDSAKDTDGDSARDSAVNRLREVIAAEGSRVLHAAKTAKNFLGWVDSFYDKWNGLREVVLELGGSESHVQKHLACSKAMVVAVTDTAKVETLAGLIQKLISSWEFRADELADAILGEQE